MSKSIVVGSTLAVLGLGGMALGAWQVQERGPEYAQIVGVEPVTRTVETPREVCEDVVVAQAAPSRDPHRIVGTAAGAIVGGLLGNQIGGGNGKKLATVAGAVGGGLAGREIQGRVEANQRHHTTQRQCRTVVDTHQETDGYEVTWRYGELTRTSRLAFAPQGERVPLEEGQPQWNAVASQGG